jgi:hypothetical protein
MRRKIIKSLLVVLVMFLALFGLYGLWVRAQLQMSQSLQGGIVRTDALTGQLIFPQTALFYGLLAGFFLLLSLVLIWVVYRLVSLEPK